MLRLGRVIMMLILLLSVLTLVVADCQEEFLAVLSLSKTLYIPGQYYSLINFTHQVQSISDYFNVTMDLIIQQENFKDQGNSVYDMFEFSHEDYSAVEPCYQEAVTYLNQLYDKFQPCQGGCSFDSVSYYSQNSTYIDLQSSQYENVSFIIDNSFYPCSGGYQSEIYLAQSLNLRIQNNTSYFFIFKVVFIVLLQILIFLFAYILIMIRKLNNKKKAVKRLRQDREDQEVMQSFERQTHEWYP